MRATWSARGWSGKVPAGTSVISPPAPQGLYHTPFPSPTSLSLWPKVQRRAVHLALALEAQDSPDGPARKVFVGAPPENVVACLEAARRSHFPGHLGRRPAEDHRALAAFAAFIAAGTAAPHRPGLERRHARRAAVELAHELAPAGCDQLPAPRPPPEGEVAVVPAPVGEARHAVPVRQAPVPAPNVGAAAAGRERPLPVGDEGDAGLGRLAERGDEGPGHAVLVEKVPHLAPVGAAGQVQIHGVKQLAGVKAGAPAASPPATARAPATVPGQH